MDLDDAKKMVSTEPPALSETRARLEAAHAEHPQRSAQAVAAIAEVEAALERLAALGHRFVLAEEMPAPAGDEYPKMLYRDGPSGGESAIAGSEEEEKKMSKDGWRTSPTPSEASGSGAKSTSSSTSSASGRT